MECLNIKSGFEKLFLAEMLAISAMIISLFTDTLLILCLVELVLLTISYIVTLIGLSKLAKDDEGYKKAYIWKLVNVLVTVVCIILILLMENNSLTASYLTVFSGIVDDVVEFLVAFFVVRTSIEVCKNISNNSMAKYNKTTLTICTITYCFGILLSMIKYLPTNAVLPTALIALAIMLTAKIVYFVFLIKMIGVLKNK